MRITTLIGLLLLVGIFLVDLGPNLSLIVDPLACTFVAVGTLGLVLTSFSLGELRHAVAIGLGAWFTTRQNSVSDIQTAEIFYRHVAIYAQVIGWIGVIFGLVIMLEDGVFGTPATWQSGLRVCILTVLYGLFIAYIVCMPIRTRLRLEMRLLKQKKSLEDS